MVRVRSTTSFGHLRTRRRVGARRHADACRGREKELRELVDQGSPLRQHRLAPTAWLCCHRYYARMKGRATMVSRTSGTPTLEKLVRSLAQSVDHMEVGQRSCPNPSWFRFLSSELHAVHASLSFSPFHSPYIFPTSLTPFHCLSYYPAGEWTHTDRAVIQRCSCFRDGARAVKIHYRSHPHLPFVSRHLSTWSTCPAA